MLPVNLGSGSSCCWGSSGVAAGWGGALTAQEHRKSMHENHLLTVQRQIGVRNTNEFYGSIASALGLCTLVQMAGFSQSLTGPEPVLHLGVVHALHVGALAPRTGPALCGTEPRVRVCLHPCAH